MLTKELNFNDVPLLFPLCQNVECPMAETCLRQLAAKVAPDETAVRPCVMPGQWKGETCEWYAEPVVVKMAYGFARLFDRVYDADGKAMRKELLRFFGYKKKYYACLRGEMPLIPAEQQFIRRMVARYGYEWEVDFDREEEQIDFPNKPY